MGILALVFAAGCSTTEADLATALTSSSVVEQTTMPDTLVAVTTTSAVAKVASTTTTTTTTEPPPPTTEVIAVGTFQGLAGHRGEGMATLVRDPVTNRTTIETRNTDIGSGPALVVYLVPGPDRRSLDDAVVIAELVAESGDHDYLVPTGIDITPGEWTVLVWCETFVIEVANATVSVA